MRIRIKLLYRIYFIGIAVFVVLNLWTTSSFYSLDDRELAIWSLLHLDLLSTEQCHQAYNSFDFPNHNGCISKRRPAGFGRPQCQFENLKIDLSKITSDKMGGEPLDESTMGQPEGAEFLQYQKGAFRTTRPFENPCPVEKSFFWRMIPSWASRVKSCWYMEDVLSSMTVAVDDDDDDDDLTCSSHDTYWEGTTLFLTRYEYVNVYHTMTDWWNCIFSSLPEQQRNNNNDEPIINVVFLDAHPEGNLDAAWKNLFPRGKVMHVRHLPSQQTCFEHARFVPAGYTSPLFPRIRQKCPDEKQTAQFVNYFLNAFNLTNVHRIPGKVVVIDRVPYVAHPRSNPEKTQRLISNLREMAQRLPTQVDVSNNNNDPPLMSHADVQVQVDIVTLAGETLAEQIQSIRQAHVLLANHGAGLTHMLFLDRHAHVVEMSCQLGFFPELATWRPDIVHHCLGPIPNTNQGIMTIPDWYWNDNVVSVVETALREERLRAIQNSNGR